MGKFWIEVVLDFLFWLQGYKFRMGDHVYKKSGSYWRGRVVGFYSTALTPVGYCIESENEPGSVQIYPESALIRSNPERL